jgi:hypothetical protein
MAVTPAGEELSAMAGRPGTFAAEAADEFAGEVIGLGCAAAVAADQQHAALLQGVGGELADGLEAAIQRAEADEIRRVLIEHAVDDVLR